MMPFSSSYLSARPRLWLVRLYTATVRFSGSRTQTSRSVTLHDDQAFVAQGAAEALSARGARLLSDASIARGGCLVESDIGVVDASIAARWKRAVAVLGCEEGWQEDEVRRSTS